MHEKLAQKRYILSTEMTSTKEYDATRFLLGYLKDLVKNSTIEGLPVIFNFKISKTDKMKTYSGNSILDFKIPVIPVSYDASSNKSLIEFIESASSKEAIIEHNKTIDPEKLDKAIDEYAEQMYAYIKVKIAERYAEAKEAGHEKIMSQLSKLDVTKNDNLDFISNIILSSKDKSSEAYKQVIEPVTHFEKLSKIMKNYENFEIFKEKFEQKNAETRKKLTKQKKYPPQKGDENQ